MFPTSARKAPRRAASLPSDFLSLSIVIPAYNEEKRLPPTLEAVLAYVQTLKLDFCEVVVVNDGSLDGTAECVRRFAATHAGIRLVENPGNRGKGYSVRHGVLKSRGEWILITDADLSSPIGELEKLSSSALREGNTIAIGSRALDRSLIGVHQPRLREICGRVFNFCMRAVAGLPYRDTQCGFKLYRADVARQVFSLQKLDGFSFDVENLFVAKKLGYEAVEVPVRWNNAEGTKVSGFSGLKSFGDLLTIRWSHARLQSIGQSTSLVPVPCSSNALPDQSHVSRN